MERRKGKRSDGLRSFLTTIYPIIFTVLPTILNIFGLPTTDILLAGFVIVYLYIILKDKQDLALYYSRVEVIALVIYLLTPLLGGLGLYYSQLLFQHKILNEFHVVIPQDKLESHMKQSKEDYVMLLKQIEKLRKSIDLQHKRENTKISILESKLLYLEDNFVYFTKQKKQIGIIEFCQTTLQDCYLWAQWILVQVISFPLVIFRFFNFISYLLLQAQSEIFGTE
ncbi:hypothetical protein HDV06_006310 [Boothiomyces sp. JEL0866]|nr:hypothetical protein HDV06_006310 [Boothiomyces sp. JEL0866]